MGFIRSMLLMFTEILSHKAPLCIAINFMVVGKGLAGKDMERTVREMIVAFKLKP
jgi:hypothetical protein